MHIPTDRTGTNEIPSNLGGEYESFLKKRRRLTLETDLQALEALLGINDKKVLHSLRKLGYSRQMLPLLHMIPLVQVAWADGSVGARESCMILEIARRRGIHSEHPAFKPLLNLLDERPSEEYFDDTLYVLSVMVTAMPAERRETYLHDLLGLCRRIAEASGGFGLINFGNKVCQEERLLLERLFIELRLGPSLLHLRAEKNGQTLVPIFDQSESWL